MRVLKSCLSKSYLKTKTAQVPCGNGTNSSFWSAFERNHSQIITLKAFSKRTALAWLRINILCSCACEHVCAPAMFKKKLRNSGLMGFGSSLHEQCLQHLANSLTAHISKFTSNIQAGGTLAAPSRFYCNPHLDLN